MTIIFMTLYFTLIATTFARFFFMLLKHPRRAILAGVIFTSLTLSALPWQLFPFRGIATALQLSFLIAAFIIFFSKSQVSVYRNPNPYLLVFLGFIVVLFTFTIHSPQLDYGFSKTAIITLRSLLPILALCVLRPFDVEDMCIIFNTIIIGSLMVALNLLSFSGLGSERAGFENLYAITAGRETGLGLTLILVYLLITPLNFYKLGLYLLPVIILILGTVITGSRGPILAPLFAVVCVMLLVEYPLGRKFRYFFRLGLIASLIFLISFTFSGEVQPTNLVSLNRVINRLSTLGNNRSDQGRIERYQLAWDGFLSSIVVGHGTGSFDFFFKRDGKDPYKGSREYPHNLFLEVAFEQGLVGLVVLVVLIGVALVKIILVTKYYSSFFQMRSIMSLFFFGFFNAMVSADIAGNYAFWVLASLPWILLSNILRHNNLVMAPIIPLKTKLV